MSRMEDSPQVMASTLRRSASMPVPALSAVERDAEAGADEGDGQR